MTLFPKSLVAAGLLSLSAGAIAQPPGPPPQGGPDGAGRPRMEMPITRAELQARLEQMFDHMDANHDGKLSTEDLAARRDAIRDKMFDKLDTNHDGMISKAEFAAAQEKRRDWAKADGEKPKMGRDKAMKDGMREGRESHRPKMRMAAMRHMGPMGFGHGAMLPDLSKGPISKADFIAQGLARFDKIDTNHDGQISPEERAAARDMTRDRRGPAGMPQTPPPGQ